MYEWPSSWHYQHNLIFFFRVKMVPAGVVIVFCFVFVSGCVLPECTLEKQIRLTNAGNRDEVYEDRAIYDVNTIGSGGVW